MQKPASADDEEDEVMLLILPDEIVVEVVGSFSVRDDRPNFEAAEETLAALL